MFKSKRVIVLAMAILPLIACNGEQSSSPMTRSEADAKMMKLGTDVVTYGREVQRVKSIGTNTNWSFLPPLTDYKVTVGETLTRNKDTVTVLSSTEKCNTLEVNGRMLDGWLNLATDVYNKQAPRIAGRQPRIEVLCVPSGTGHEFILSKQYQGIIDAYMPSNELWSELVNVNEPILTLIEKSILGNIPGVVIREDVFDKLEEQTFKGLLLSDQNYRLGGADPYVSSTMLSALSEAELIFSDSDISKIGSAETKQKMRDFLINHIARYESSTLAFEASLKRNPEDSRSLHGAFMEFQTFQNSVFAKDPAVNYGFLPIGIKHDNPLYLVGNDSWEKKVLENYAKFLKKQEWQSEAKNYGFNVDWVSDWKSAYMPSGEKLKNFQTFWKENKDGDSKVAVCFVADTSGSMGHDMYDLKKSLTKVFQSNSIKPSTDVCLISFSYQDEVKVLVKPAPFGNAETKGRLLYAVDQLDAGGNTASYSAAMKAAEVLLKHKGSQKDMKLYTVLMTDGDRTEGYTSDQVTDSMQRGSIRWIPVVFGNRSNEMINLAEKLEASKIRVSGGNVAAQIKAIFNRNG